MFQMALEDIVSEMASIELLAIPGVYEIVSEYLNNEVLDALERERCERHEPGRIASLVHQLSRSRCEHLLTIAGIQVYDEETIETLREAVRSNVEDGTIAATELEVP
jgi:hypothetical protein